MKSIKLICFAISIAIFTDCNNPKSNQSDNNQVVDTNVSNQKTPPDVMTSSKILGNSLSSKGLYHHVHFMQTGDKSSLTYLEENEKGLYHHVHFMQTGDKSSLRWLKDNNQGLYHHVHFMQTGDKSSLTYLEENEKGLYHHVHFMQTGDKSSLQWLKNKVLI